MNEELSKFIPLAKIEEHPDGTLNVYGLVTAEEPDLDGEVCDYATTAPLYRAQASRMLKITSGIAGMEPSLMPMREMHELKAIGAGRSMDFDDTAKAIRMGFNVVEPDAILKFKKGVLIGFSQGGKYIKRWDDPVHKGKTRYTADPGEVSAVDSPCLPSALVESMKSRTYEMQKANGSVEVKKFEIPEDGVLRLERVERSLEMLTELAKRQFTTAERRHDAATGAALPDGSFPIENEQDLHNAISAYGRASDKEKAKAHITARAKSLGLTHLLPEDWEAAKAATGGKETDMAKITDEAGLKKAAKSLHDHLERLEEAHKAHGEHLKKAHEGIAAKHEKLGEHIKKAMDACKAAMEGDEPEEAEKAEKPDAIKALETKLDEMQKASTDAIAALTEKLSKLPAPSAIHSGVTDGGRSGEIDPELFKGVQVTH